MTDIELAALTEVVKAERFGMETENEERKRHNYAPAYSGNVRWESLDVLEAELNRRGILKNQ